MITRTRTHSTTIVTLLPPPYLAQVEGGLQGEGNEERKDLLPEVVLVQPQFLAGCCGVVDSCSSGAAMVKNTH